MTGEAWGPFLPDLNPAERLARLCPAGAGAGAGGLGEFRTCRHTLRRAEAELAVTGEALAILDRLPALHRRRLLTRPFTSLQPPQIPSQELYDAQETHERCRASEGARRL